MKKERGTCDDARFCSDSNGDPFLLDSFGLGVIINNIIILINHNSIINNNNTNNINNNNNVIIVVHKCMFTF